MTLGEKIKSTRDAYHFTLKELSHQSGLSISYLSDIERGRTLPSIPALVKIADGFNETVLVLLIGVEFGERITQDFNFLKW